MNTTGTQIRAGDTVRVEYTRGWATATPTTRIVEGVAFRDEAGALRIDDGVNSVNLESTDGYFARGVVVLSVKGAF